VRIELTHYPWQGQRLPLHHTRMFFGAGSRIRTGFNSLEGYVLSQENTRIMFNALYRMRVVKHTTHFLRRSAMCFTTLLFFYPHKDKPSGRSAHLTDI